MLGRHDQTMTLLKNAVAKIAEYKQSGRGKQASDLGQPAGDSTPTAAPAATGPSPFVGRRTSEKTAADRALFASLGLPTE
jgi:hypothetical protein